MAAARRPRTYGRFDDFVTIDWAADILQRYARGAVSRANSAPVQAWLGASQSWLALLAVGVLIGANTAAISVVTEWLSDVKLGRCRDSWWLNEKFCCWEQWDARKHLPAPSLMLGVHWARSAIVVVCRRVVR